MPDLEPQHLLHYDILGAQGGICANPARCNDLCCCWRRPAAQQMMHVRTYCKAGSEQPRPVYISMMAGLVVDGGCLTKTRATAELHGELLGIQCAILWACHAARPSHVTLIGKAVQRVHGPTTDVLGETQPGRSQAATKTLKLSRNMQACNQGSSEAVQAMKLCTST